MPYQHWTQIEIERLKTLAAKGLTLTIVAARLGRTPSSVFTKARKAGICFTSGRISLATTTPPTTEE